MLMSLRRTLMIVRAMLRMRMTMMKMKMKMMMMMMIMALHIAETLHQCQAGGCLNRHAWVESHSYHLYRFLHHSHAGSRLNWHASAETQIYYLYQFLHLSHPGGRSSWHSLFEAQIDYYCLISSCKVLHPLIDCILAFLQTCCTLCRRVNYVTILLHFGHGRWP